ncbi:MAG: HAD family phosphatase [Chloroflexi bacterium]|nr:HAD family phosphatase [Chloroflexota bacterium]
MIANSSFKLVALDLDGTIIGPDLCVSERTRKVIQRAVSRGVHVTIATGRMFQATLPFARMLGFATPLICYQGALIARPSDEAFLFHRPVPLGLARQVLMIARKRGLQLNLYVDDQLYVERLTPAVESYIALSRVQPRVVGDLLAFLKADPTKIVSINDEPTTYRLVAEMSQRFNGRLYVTKSYPYFTEFAHPACSKGRALRWLASFLGVSREEVLAVGDNLNDVEMLEWSGLGVAMGGADGSVKRRADLVTGTLEEDGAAQVIEKYVLR